MDVTKRDKENVKIRLHLHVGPSNQNVLSSAIFVLNMLAQHLMRSSDVEPNTGPVIRAVAKVKHMQEKQDADAMEICADWY